MSIKDTVSKIVNKIKKKPIDLEEEIKKDLNRAILDTLYYYSNVIEKIHINVDLKLRSPDIYEISFKTENSKNKENKNGK